MAEADLKVYKEEDVSKHNLEEDCWMIIGNADTGGPKVYDVTKYLDDHPGGPEIMLQYAGMDADEMFESIGHSSEARSLMKKYLIGKLEFDPSKVKSTKKKIADVKSKGGLNPVVLFVLLIALALGYYYSQNK